MDRPLIEARHLLDSRYSDATAGFLTGTATTQLMTPTPDLDLVVVGDGAEARWQGTHTDRWSVEAFVSDREGWDRYVAEEIRSRCPVVLRITATGLPLLEGEESGALQAAPRTLLEAGPSPLDDRERHLRRRLLTDLVDDLEDTRDAVERAFLVEATLRQAAELWLLGNRRWSGEGKWLGRLLAQMAPELGQELAEAARSAHDGDPSRMVEATAAVLDLAGGPVREDWEDPPQPRDRRDRA